MRAGCPVSPAPGGLQDERLDVRDDVVDLFLHIDAGEVVHHLPALARFRIDARGMSARRSSEFMTALTSAKATIAASAGTYRSSGGNPAATPATRL